jgi:[protein-PII] uridylyltransferase
MSRLRPAVAVAREQLAQGRSALHERHRAGAGGLEICRAMTDLMDQVVLGLCRAADAEVSGHGASLAEQVAVVVHGGFGRRELAPYSDIDLMILCQSGAETRVHPLMSRLLQDVSDVRLQLGHSVRTISDACQLARDDPATFTSLAEARFLAGRQSLFDDFWQKFVQMARWRRRRFMVAVETARQQERAQFGETVYLLEPNIKRSCGALRDVQLLRWFGFAAYGVADPEALHRRGFLDEDDLRVVQNGVEFLLRLRNEMHFHAGKAHDLLDRREQVRLAAVGRYPGRDGLLPVEQFMQEYFERTQAVNQVVEQFMAQCRPARMSQLLDVFSHQVEGNYRVGAYIAATRQGQAKLGQLSEILRLAELANLYDKPIAPATLDVLRLAARQLPDDVQPEAAQRFMAVLGHPARLGEVLRVLHHAGVLERLVPGFVHARGLLQFNEYHKFTVDEHSLQAVERATKFQEDQGPLGQAYRGVRNKPILHLALLIHDLGKGYAEDHSEVGRRLAEQNAAHLGLSASDAELLKFLVHKHLLMSHLAFRRDTSDERLILDFVGQVGSPEVLQLLYVLTCADLAAVGPEVFNDWKRDVLTALYNRAMRHLDADRKVMTSDQHLGQLREAVWTALGASAKDAGFDEAWFNEQIDALPVAYLEAHGPREIARELCRLHELPPREVVVQARYVPENETLEYTISTHEEVTAGVFYKLTGALTSQGLEILFAEINTLARGLIVDRFVVRDNDFQGKPPPERIEAVRAALRQALLTTTDKAPSFRRLWRQRQGSRTADLAPPPTRVVADNNTSDRFTVLDVFATDRTGLLYTIARALFDLGLSVSVAKIATYLDQVVDVFYVTDRAGGKITDEARLTEIRRFVVQRIEEFDRSEAEKGGST